MKRVITETGEVSRASLPRARASKQVSVTGFDAIDRRRRLDSASLLGGYGIGQRIPGALSSEKAPSDTGERYPSPICMSSVGDSLAIFFRRDGETVLAIRGGQRDVELPLGEYPSAAHGRKRSVSAFNRYSDPLDAVGGRYEKQLLVFPDKLRIGLDGDEWQVSDMEESSSIPDLERACVHLSRLFGTGEDRIWVSAYNEPENFELDTATDYGAASAWASTLQSNTRADSPISAPVLYDGQLLCFKRNFCHAINNNKNPFRVADLFCRGAISAEAIAEAGGRLYFVSDDGIYAYGGGSPERISDPLGLRDYGGALLCGAGDTCYIYLPSAHAIYTYSAAVGFGRLALPDGLRPIALAATDEGAYALSEEGALWRLSGEQYGEYCFESAYLTLGFDTPWRIESVSVTAELGVGAHLTVSARTPGGEESRLGEFVGEGGGPRTFHCDSTAAAAPPDDCHSIVLSGDGDAVVLGLRVRGSAAG